MARDCEALETDWYHEAPLPGLFITRALAHGRTFLASLRTPSTLRPAGVS